MIPAVVVTFSEVHPRMDGKSRGNQPRDSDKERRDTMVSHDVLLEVKTLTTHTGKHVSRFDGGKAGGHRRAESRLFLQVLPHHTDPDSLQDTHTDKHGERTEQRKSRILLSRRRGHCRCHSSEGHISLGISGQRNYS